MLGGFEDGVSARLSASGTDATETLRRTMHEAFRRHARGDADLILFQGCNHMVFCDPVDPTCRAGATDRPLTCNGRLARKVMGGVIVDFLRSRGLGSPSSPDEAAVPTAACHSFRPKIPAFLRHATESFRADGSAFPALAVASGDDGYNVAVENIWRRVSSTLDSWISKIVGELQLDPSHSLPENSQNWTAGNMTGSLMGWQSSKVVWAV